MRSWDAAGCIGSLAPPPLMTTVDYLVGKVIVVTDGEAASAHSTRLRPHCPPAWPLHPRCLDDRYGVCSMQPACSPGQALHHSPGAINKFRVRGELQCSQNPSPRALATRGMVRVGLFRQAVSLKAIKLLVLMRCPVVCPGKVPSSWGLQSSRVRPRMLQRVCSS
ncbi:hypothetical protein HaLaN_22712 [Haematococcus lacustris]|uniref:Uncharacterized protein n=1 Tax=Haematococcus lacustris TaxID=44745 RepID=A0A6A0A0F1_HAELA|nr:hypothetical protein HaLaN_22712 [Haematococcus lacustris]